jgi:electron transport complex protein RnfC
VKAVYTKYPQGSERHLIYAVTKRQINSSMLPADAGCIVDNVDTIFAVRRAVLERKPLISRIVTVTGDAIEDPRNFEVLLGTNMRELIDAAEDLKRNRKKLLPVVSMMGMAMFNLDVPAVKGSSALLCFIEDEVAKQEESPCINCGRCLQVCPSRIMPNKLSELSERGDMDTFVKMDAWNVVNVDVVPTYVRQKDI